MQVEFTIGFEITSPFDGFFSFDHNGIHKPYKFKKGDKFCILPPDFVISDNEYEELDLDDPKYYIKCIPNVSSFGDLLLVSMAKLRRKSNKWIIDELKNSGGHTYVNGIFHKKEGIWYYDCDS